MADSTPTKKPGPVEHASTPNKPAGTPNAPDSKVEYETVSVQVPKNMDPGHKASLIRSLEGNKETLVGNFADLQRMGAAVVTGGSLEDGVLAPPETHPDEAEPFEDVIAPGPAGMTADAAEELYGSDTAQGERP